MSYIDLINIKAHIFKFFKNVILTNKINIKELENERAFYFENTTAITILDAISLEKTILDATDYNVRCVINDHLLLGMKITIIDTIEYWMTH